MSTQVSVRALTSGPASHWFGYYDKCQFDPTDRFVLAMETTIDRRSPRPEDVIQVAMIDLEEGDRWIPLGESCAWCWQQGCMLQWVPGTRSTVLWNDREQDRFVCHLLDVATGEKRTIPSPVYALCPDGRTAVSADFRRINDTRPGYGYCGIPDPNADHPAPEDAGIWTVDLRTGHTDLIVSFAQAASVPWELGSMDGCKHWFNHLLVNPDGTRLEFLHRWKRPDAGHWDTRMFTVNLDGSELRVVNNGPLVSHFIWADPHRIAMFTRPAGQPPGFYLADERNGEHTLLYDDPHDGHLSYLPGNEWIVNDCYPKGEPPLQTLYLYHVATGRRVELGHFPTRGEETYGEWRCDLHPRSNRAGTQLTIDSFMNRSERQLYLVDIAGVV